MLLQLPVQRNRRLLAIAVDAEIRTRVFHDLLGENREPDAAEDDGGFAEPANSLHQFGQLRHEPLGAGPEAVVHVAKRQADQGGAALEQMLAQRLFRVLAEGKVENVHFDPGVSRRFRHILQSNRPNGRHHAIRVYES